MNDTQEQFQGTFDNVVDSDGDGISDYDESRWSLYYDEKYCDMQSTPRVCSYPDPKVKDLYVEIDWMKDGTNEYKPSSAQLNPIKDMFLAKGINVHFDVGEYGGGNEIPVYDSSIYFREEAGSLDIHDIKYGGEPTDTGLISTLPEQFSPYRQNIWRYMIYGVDEISELGSSVAGVAEALGDDIVIASENSNTIDGYLHGKDRAISGLITHELGHSLCLTNAIQFIEQYSGCEFSTIDTYNSWSSYLSVMNNNYTLPKDIGLLEIDYSDGSNGSGDHDDWGAINLGMGAFIYGPSLTPVLFEADRSSTRHADDKPIVKSKSDEKRKDDVRKLYKNVPFKISQKALRKQK